MSNLSSLPIVFGGIKNLVDAVINQAAVKIFSLLAEGCTQANVSFAYVFEAKTELFCIDFDEF